MKSEKKNKKKKAKPRPKNNDMGWVEKMNTRFKKQKMNSVK